MTTVMSVYQARRGIWWSDSNIEAASMPHLFILVLGFFLLCGLATCVLV